MRNENSHARVVGLWIFILRPFFNINHGSTAQKALCLSFSSSVPSRVTLRSAGVRRPKPRELCSSGPFCPRLHPLRRQRWNSCRLEAPLDLNSEKCLCPEPRVSPAPPYHQHGTAFHFRLLQDPLALSPTPHT